jgi:hypothetical protein
VAEQRVAATDPGRGVSRIDGQSAIEIGESSVVLPQLHVRAPAVGERPKVIGTERDRPVVAWNGLGEAVEGEQQIAAAGMRIGKIRVECDRLIVAAHRVLDPVERLEHDAEIGVGLGRARVDLERALDRCRSGLEIALQIMVYAEQVQRLEVVGLLAQRFQVFELGLSEPARSLQLLGALESAVVTVPRPGQRRIGLGPLSAHPDSLLRGDGVGGGRDDARFGRRPEARPDL